MSDNELSINLLTVSIQDDTIQSVNELRDIVEKQSIQMLEMKAEFNDLNDTIEKQNIKILEMKAEFNGRVHVLFNIITMKEDIINKM